MEGMKKRFTGLVAFVATLAMVLGMVTPAFAATITVNQSEDGHSYVAYQILDADITEKPGHTDVRLSNVNWGSNVDSTKLIQALKDSKIRVYAATSNQGDKSETTVGTVFANVSTAQDFAAVFDWASDNSALADAVASIINTSMASSNEADHILKGSGVPASQKDDKSGYTFEISDPGYYYIQDGAASTENGRYFVQIFNDDKEIAAKNATPSLEKKVQENTKATDQTAFGNQFNDTADYSIGDFVTFKLVGQIPDMTAYNNGYRYTITDTLSTSLTRPSITNGASAAVKVFLTNSQNSNVSLTGTVPSDAVDVTSYFSVATSEVPANSMTIQPNIAGSANKTSGANDLSAVPGIASYKYVVVVYQAQLNENAALGQQTISGNTMGETNARGNVNKAHLSYSNNPSFPDDTHNGETPDDYVIVFTYGVDLTKVSAANTSQTLENASFYLVKGSYNSADGATNSYAILTGNSTNGWKLTGWTTNRNDATQMTTATGGKVQIAGLDDGTYSLLESSTPNGYNQPTQPWTITITANTSNGQNGNGAVSELADLSGTISNGSFTSSVAFRGQDKGLVSGDVSASKDTGLVSAKITNTQGFQLPSTGGLGSMALTVAGIAIVACAGIILTIRKRANDEQ